MAKKSATCNSGNAMVSTSVCRIEMTFPARFAMSLAALCCIGCGDDSGYSGPTGSMTGRVSIDGAAPPDGTVMVLIHKASGSATSAKVQADGAYSLTNVRVGEYMVGFTNSKSSTAAQIDPDAAMRAIEDGTYRESPQVFPAELADPSSSGHTLTVQ
jgi:hypothetical protein